MEMIIKEMMAKLLKAKGAPVKNKLYFQLKYKEI